jgi:hypothetical protein
MVDILIGEDAGFMIIGPVTCLLKESRRKMIGIGFVVNKLRVNIIDVDLNSVSLSSTFLSSINTYIPLESLTCSLSCFETKTIYI